MLYNSVRTVIENLISNGSTVNLCALDLFKAFDRINHYARFVKLINLRAVNGGGRGYFTLSVDVDLSRQPSETSHLNLKSCIYP